MWRDRLALVADGKGVCGATTDIGRTACAHRFMYASVYADVHRAKIHIDRAQHVYSHQEVEGAPDELRHHRKGNKLVDTLARRLAQAELPTGSAYEEIDKMYTNAIDLIKASARMMALWPFSHELYGELSRAPRDPSVPLVEPHRFRWAGRTWQCMDCLRVSSEHSSVPRTCTRIPRRFRRLVDDPGDHTLWIAEADRGGAPLVYCSACARHGTATSIRKLLAQCPRTPISDQYRYFRTRLSHGYHPTIAQCRLRRPVPCRDLAKEDLLITNHNRLAGARQFVDRRPVLVPRPAEPPSRLGVVAALPAEAEIGFEDMDEASFHRAGDTPVASSALGQLLIPEIGTALPVDCALTWQRDAEK